MGGPSSSKRRLLAAVMDSIMLYGAPVWCKSVDIAHYRQKLMRMQRVIAIRVSRAYRTVSGNAALVFSGLTPIDLLAKERKRVYEGTGGGKKEKKRENNGGVGTGMEEFGC